MSNRVEKDQIRDYLEGYHRSYGFPIRFYGNQIGTVLIGEWHYLFENEQAELIEALRPSRLILEHLGGLNYDPHADTLVKAEGRGCPDFEVDLIAKSLLTSHSDRPYGLRIFYELSRKYGIPLLGCDLTITEMAQASILERGEENNEISEIKKLMSSPDKMGRLIMQRTRSQRDRQMKRFISNHQGTPDNPSVAIVGQLHSAYINSCGVLNNYASIEQLPDSLTRRNAPLLASQGVAFRA